MSSSLVIAAVGAICGCALGSYAVTAGMRYARAEGSTFGRSRCDGCQRSLPFKETVPLWSFFASRGRCRTCRAGIDRLHLIGELAGGLAVAASIMLLPGLEGVLVSGMAIVLLASAAADWRSKRLPNLCTAIIAVLGLTLSALDGPMAILTGIVAALLSVALLQVLRLANSRRKADPGLGFGDVKLVGALALWLGVSTPWMVVGAASLGLVMVVLLKPAAGVLPFGPAIALSGWLLGLVMEAGRWPMSA